MRLSSAIAVLVLGCGSEPDAADPAVMDSAAPVLCAVDTGAGMLPAPTWAEFGVPFFSTWCQSCHSRTTPQRAGAPEGVDFDSASDVQQAEAAIRRTVLESRSMPVGGGLPEADLHDLDRLLRCGP